MLQFLEAGQGVYVVAAICVLGILSKFMVNSFYKRAIKQTDNMATTRNRFLKGFRQKTENTYWINQGIYNARAYIERQMFGHRFLGISLNGWDGFAAQAVLLSLIAGGVGAYLSYWYQLDSSYIILYGAAAVMSSLVLLLAEQTVKTEQKQEQLVVCLLDYIENSIGRRAANRMEKEEKELTEQQPKDSNIVSMERGGFRNKAEDEEREDEQIADSKKEDGARVQNMSARRAASVVGKRRGARSETALSDESSSLSEHGKRSSLAEIENLRKNAEAESLRKTAEIESLRKSMEQAAAAKEKGLGEGAAKNPQGVDLTKILEPDQIQILGEIFKEYLK